MSDEEKKPAYIDEPPAYSDPAPATDGAAVGPPSYQELFGGMTGVQEMRSGLNGVRQSEDAGGKASGLVTICCALFGTVFCSICYLLLSAWPIALIVVGAIDLNQCNLNRNIPIWMIVYGCFCLVLTVISVTKQCCCKKSKDDEDSEENKRNRKKQGCNMCESLIIIFLMVWIFIGSSWVFGSYSAFRAGPGSCRELSQNATLPGFHTCCEPGAYLFAFGSLLAVYSLWGLCCIGLVLFACFGVCCMMLSSD